MYLLVVCLLLPSLFFWILLSPLQAWCLNILFLSKTFLSSQEVVILLPPHLPIKPGTIAKTAREGKCPALVLFWKYLICIPHNLSCVSQTCSLQLLYSFPLSDAIVALVIVVPELRSLSVTEALGMCLYLKHGCLYCTTMKVLRWGTFSNYHAIYKNRLCSFLCF